MQYATREFEYLHGDCSIADTTTTRNEPRGEVDAVDTRDPSKLHDTTSLTIGLVVKRLTPLLGMLPRSNMNGDLQMQVPFHARHQGLVDVV